MRLVRAFLAIVLALSASPAFAQRVGADGVPYRLWDVHGGGGFQSINAGDGWQAGGSGHDNWEAVWAGSVDVGRYWTSHLKSEAGVVFLGDRYEYSEGDAITLPSGLQGFPTFSAHIREVQVVLAGTYQFFDNTFAHPYLSAGVRVGVLDVHAIRYPYVSVYGSGRFETFSLPPLEQDSTEVRARPFVAFGSKSYLSERTFIRPEMMMAFNAGGASQFGLRLGFGVDF